MRIRVSVSRAGKSTVQNRVQSAMFCFRVWAAGSLGGSKRLWSKGDESMHDMSCVSLFCCCKTGSAHLASETVRVTLHTPD